MSPPRTLSALFLFLCSLALFSNEALETQGTTVHFPFTHCDRNGWRFHDKDIYFSFVTCEGDDSRAIAIWTKSTNRIDVASHTLGSPQKIQYFSYNYLELKHNEGGGIRLLNGDKQVEMGVGTSEGGIDLHDKEGFRRVHRGLNDTEGPIDITNQVKVQVAFDWDSSTVHVSWAGSYTEMLFHTVNGSLIHGKPIHRIVWSKYHSNRELPEETQSQYKEWGVGESLMHMGICGLQYVTSNCSAGSYFSREKFTCVECPPGTYSEDGNSCHSCPKDQISKPGSKAISNCFPKHVLYTFESRILGGWTIQSESVFRSWSSCTSAGELSLTICNNYTTSHGTRHDMAYNTLDPSYNIEAFAYTYCGEGIVRLVNEKGQTEMEIAMDDNIVQCQRETGVIHMKAESEIERGVGLVSRGGYTVHVDIHWKNNSFSILSTGGAHVAKGSLAYGHPIDTIILANTETSNHSLSGEHEKCLHVSRLQYVTHCESGEQFSLEGFRCVDCPPGTFGVDGRECKDCPAGTSSVRGSKNRVDCMPDHVVLSGDRGDWAVCDNRVRYSTCCGGNNTGTKIREASSFSTDIASHILPQPNEIEALSYFYYEWGGSDGGGIRLFNRQGTMELGIASDKGSNLKVMDASNVLVHANTKTYEVWFRVDVNFHWGRGQFSLNLAKVGVNSTTPVCSYTGILKTGLPIKTITWSNYHDLGFLEGWIPNSAIHMQICRFQYVTGCTKGRQFNMSEYRCVNCAAGTYNSEGSVCLDCPSGRISDQGSGECMECPAGKYSRGGTECRECVAGRGSEKGTAQCFLCPPGTYSTGTTPCMDCPQENTSKAGAEAKDDCFFFSPSPSKSPIPTISRSSSVSASKGMLPGTSGAEASEGATVHTDFRRGSASGIISVKYVLPLGFTALLLISIGVVAYIRRRNVDRSRQFDDPLDIYATGMEIPMQVLRVGSSRENAALGYRSHARRSDSVQHAEEHTIGRTGLDNEGKVVSVTPTPAEKSSSPQIYRDSRNPIDEQHKATRSLTCERQDVETCGLACGVNPLVRAASRFQSTQVSVLEFSEKASPKQDSIKIVSTKAPNVREAVRRNGKRTVKFASISNIEAGELRVTERAVLSLRQWKARLLAEPPPLVEIETQIGKKPDETAQTSASSPSDLELSQYQYARPEEKTARGDISKEAKNEQSRNKFQTKKEFGQTLPGLVGSSTSTRKNLPSRTRSRKRQQQIR
eukprot:gb/GECG01009259.1/.p1 GENE.gb/GECG01009259.1/~~gb/GECG01009259.1/.p1  ORF type:complete len:1219 (+),score=131.50 gb/GECG01009259.1/:1-3657(+)